MDPKERRAQQRRARLASANAMVDAYERLTGRRLDARERDSRHRRGWSVAAMDAMQRVTDFAWANRTGFYFDVRVLEHEWREAEDRAQMGMLLAHTGFALGLAEVPIESVVPWVAMVAGAPDKDERGRVHAMAFDRDEYGVASATRWVRAAPGREGALAYAAGLTPIEAAQRSKEGQLAVDGLATLAVLRGWKIAPDLLIPYEPSRTAVVESAPVDLR